ncbi:MAG: hypothetical protein J7L45_01935 [Candidatus Aenigmarchaeota archaeon]|nr:hypothetical protein [Candidatus Aenigmarchaeota archaeon]
MKTAKIIGMSTIIFIAFIILSTNGLSENIDTDKLCMVYFTGVGCPHCARTDPLVIEKLPVEHKNLVIIEYEIYQNRENAPLLLEYHKRYGTGEGIPLTVFGDGSFIIGDRPILVGIEKKISEVGRGNCLLLNGTESFEEINIDNLPGKPKIWANGRVLIKVDNKVEDKNISAVAKEMLFSDAIKGTSINPVPVHLSGKDLTFSNAVKIGNNWILEYDQKEEERPENDHKNGYLPAVLIILLIVIIGGVVVWKVLR